MLPSAIKVSKNCNTYVLLELLIRDAESPSNQSAQILAVTGRQGKSASKTTYQNITLPAYISGNVLTVP